jgi:hypothetical protein
LAFTPQGFKESSMDGAADAGLDIALQIATSITQ